MSSHSCVPSRSLNRPPDAPELEPVAQRSGESAPHELAHVRVAEQSAWPSRHGGRLRRHADVELHASLRARRRAPQHRERAREHRGACEDAHARSADARGGRRSAAPSAPTAPSRRRRPAGRSRAPRRCRCGTTRVAGSSCRPTLSGLAGAFTSHPRPASAKNTHAPSSRRRVRRCAPAPARHRDVQVVAILQLRQRHALALRGPTGRRRDLAARADVDAPRTLRKSKPGTVPGTVDRESTLEGQGIAAQPSARHQAHVELRVRRDAVVSARVEEEAVVARRARAGQARVRRRRSGHVDPARAALVVGEQIPSVARMQLVVARVDAQREVREVEPAGVELRVLAPRDPVQRRGRTDRASRAPASARRCTTASGPHSPSRGARRTADRRDDRSSRDSRGGRRTTRAPPPRCSAARTPRRPRCRRSARRAIAPNCRPARASNAHVVSHVRRRRREAALRADDRRRIESEVPPPLIAVQHGTHAHGQPFDAVVDARRSRSRAG